MTKIHESEPRDKPYKQRQHCAAVSSWVLILHGFRNATVDEMPPDSPTKVTPDRCVGATGNVLRVLQNLSSPSKLIGKQDQTSAAADRCLGAAGNVHKMPSYARGVHKVPSYTICTKCLHIQVPAEMYSNQNTKRKYPEGYPHTQDE